jgi:hypothetical protein
VLSAQLLAKNRTPFELSIDEYAVLAHDGLQRGLDWLPQDDNGYISGEPPERQRVAQRFSALTSRFRAPNSIRARVLRRLIHTLRNDHGKVLANDPTSLSNERLNELDTWLAGAKQVRLTRG